ncbi:MAG: hypothetical protein II937_13550 [Bacteroidales bacterium]|nr:hypothetical protein [Bacteroidales bacterium]
MRTTELMINDLVQEWNNDHTETHIIKVEKPMREGVYDKWNHFHDADWIEPIPFTTDSAKKNGLIDYDDDIYQDDKFNWGIDFRNYEFYTFNEEVDNTIKPILFFHDLQHALRLVGLTEIADNLKC